jgi:hypothetical protein
MLLRLVVALSSAWGLFDGGMRLYVWWTQRQFGSDVFRDAGPDIDFFIMVILLGVPLALAGFILSIVLTHRPTNVGSASEQPENQS